MKTARELFHGFSFVGVDPFPVDLCDIPNKREPEVRDSSEDSYHVVITVDKRFDCFGAVRKMKPYVCEDREEPFAPLLCGWVDANGNFCDHGENGIHGDNEKVFAWKPCQKGFNLGDSFKLGA